MISFLSSLRGQSRTSAQRFSVELRACIKAIEQGRLRCRIPRQLSLYQSHPHMQYHFKPELFVQLDGLTEFTFPDERFTLKAGEVCIIPKGLPHAEFVRGEVNPFENLVISFYNGMIDVHLAHEVAPGRPRADAVYLYTSSLYDELVGYLNRVCDLHERGAATDTPAIRGLLLAEFSFLQSIVEAPGAIEASATDSVALCQWLIHHNLQAEDLGLQSLAAEIDCSPAYLSKRFHEQTGETIIERINRLRLENAADALRQTRHSVKMIASACGFGDANYFTRVFKQKTGRSPLQYRQEHERQSLAAGAEPQVIPAFEADGPEPGEALLRRLGAWRKPAKVGRR